MKNRKNGLLAVGLAVAGALVATACGSAPAVTGETPPGAPAAAEEGKSCPPMVFTAGHADRSIQVVRGRLRDRER